MDGLDRKGLIVKATRKSRLSNSLVIITESSSALRITSARDLATDKVKKLALADPKAVPVGVYSKEYLEKTGMWSTVESKVIPVDNVRAALAAVESGNVEVGIVYKTDAVISKKVKIAWEIPIAEGPKISYSMAVVKETKQREAAMRFLRHLESEEAMRVFEKFGFIVLK
jgi:molybdate transport system substrate-binding protein